ncbi:hypothetical protein QZM97_26525 [Burkholderia orbicola]|uniref:Uncharacterized protein n=1 Tax=Burkholderia cenocepacia TaxID=95486 RepID=A0A427NM10_9BURK|nr:MULTISPECIES: hypothetical protein [Burkholderia cepacia complex]MBJ9734061.1 hypothetical protein [Burkholderia cenocepacia]MDN7529009.1 hypothetical protein [Burkholderia orbicola]MDN7993639.1 hypothetical protein [Burkholderia orbicola]RSC03819.1 hypothetical protein EGT41_31475 [Burkholderia cenocepacia]
MHYNPDDVSRLFLGVPTLQLNRAAPAERFLAAAVESGIELRHVLRDYPHVRYQPLDFHYLCQQSLSALDDPLLADLTCDMQHGWRGAHWAALLIALSGNARYLPHLDAAGRHRGVEWTAGLAKAASAPDAQSSACRCCRSIVQLRHQLAALPRVVVRLRPWHSPEALEARANAVRAAYRSGGADAALPLARR